MDRRSYLRGIAGVGSAAGVTALSGCSGLLGNDGNPDVSLSPPDDGRDPENLPYPGYGQRVPDVTLTDPVARTDVDVRDVETPYLLTFIFTNCRNVCPLLTQALKRVQDDAAANGYGDAVTFLDLTFDPARDDAERFEAYAEERDVDLSAGNWHFLRAGGPDRTRTVVAEPHPDGFGVRYRRDDRTGTATGTGGGTATGGGGDATATTAGSATTAGDGDHHDGYGFTHLSLVLLVNAEGYVERAYTGANPPVDRILDDLSGLR